MSGPFDRSAHLEEALSALLDGELPGPSEEEARAHLATCPYCADELRAVDQARRWVRSLPAVDPPFGFYDRVVLTSATSFASAGPGLRRRAGLAALVAAAAAVTVLGIGSPGPGPVRPAVSRLVEAHAASASVGADLLSKLAPVGVPVSFGR